MIWVTLIIYYILLQWWKPYKERKANTYFSKAEIMFGMALALLLFTEVKQQDLTFEQSKYMGWISCYLFALAWIFMLRSLNYMVSKESKISKKGMLPIKSPAKKEKVKQLKKNLPI